MASAFLKGLAEAQRAEREERRKATEQNQNTSIKMPVLTNKQSGIQVISPASAQGVETKESSKSKWMDVGAGRKSTTPVVRQAENSNSVIQTSDGADQNETEFDLGKFLLGTVAKGGNAIAKAGGATLAFLEKNTAGTAMNLLTGDDEYYKELPFYQWNEGIKAEGEALDEHFASNTEAGGTVAKIAETVGAGAIAAIPQAVVALGTLGGSLGAQGLAATSAAAQASPGILSTLKSVAGQMAKNPNYWTSFFTSVGSDYEEAKSNGASDTKASLYAMGSSLMNAAVEVGGGIQTLPMEMQRGKSAFKVWVNSMLDEGKEEAVQGVISRAMQNVVYDKGNAIASITDQNAVLNPVTAAKEAGMGMAIGGILGGGQMLASNVGQEIMPKLSRSDAEIELENAKNAVPQQIAQRTVAQELRMPRLTDPLATTAIKSPVNYAARPADIPDIMPKLTDPLAEAARLQTGRMSADSNDDIMPKLGDGLGAANVNSLNTDYDRLQAQSDTFYPEGANAARPVDVSTRDFAGRRISKSASTIMGAEAIPDSVIPQIEQMVADGQLSYVRRGDRAAINNARRLVVDNGFDGALERFRSAVTSGKISKDTVVLGQTLMNNAANAGDGKALAEILTLYQSLNTNAGQAVQAASILRKLSPEAQLYGIQKTVSSMNGNLQKTQKNFPGAEIDAALIDKFLAQTDQAGRDAVMEEIYQTVANQVPSTWRDKWNAWRYLAMLGNPRTHIRNIVGNVGFQPVRIIKNEIATALERAFSAAGANIERTKSFAVAPSLYRAAWNDYGNAAGVLGGSKYDDVRGEIQSRRRIFKTDMLEAVRKGNSAALEFEDAVFKRITYADALAGYLQANGATAAQLESGQIDSALLSHARDYAVQEALKATYQDSNVISERTSRIAKSMGVVGDAVMPFQRTPANILSRALEYSPAGLIKSLTADLAKVKAGNMSVSQALDNIAAGLTGSGLFGLGMHLFALGLVTGGQGDSEDDKWDSLLGHQGYALELPGGTSVTLDWLAPESLPFFMGVEFMSAVGENGFQASDIIDAMKSVANPMLELSMLQGVNDLIESVRYAEETPLMAIIPSVITSYFSQAVPTLLGQLERSGENIRMTTYTDKNRNLHPDIQYAIGRASSRIPGLDYAQIPYIDAWGREEESDDLVERTVKNLLNPAYVSQVEVDSVENELQRLRDSTGETAVFPDRAERYITVDGERKYLAVKEYVSYAKMLGQESYNLISQAINSPAYRGMSDSNKAEYVGRIYDYAKQTAKASVSDYVVDTWVQNAKNAQRDIGVSPVEYMALYEKYGSEIMSGTAYEKTKLAVSVGLTVDEYAAAKYGLDANRNGSVTQAEAQVYLDHQDFSKEQKADLWTVINKNWKTNPYA